MATRNSATSWGWPARLLHWLVAIGIIALLYLGLEQADMPRGDEKTRIRFIHASLATVVLALMTLRILWRGLNETPAHPDGMPRWQAVTSQVVHWGLYAVVFAQLLAGAMVSGTGGRGLPFFGLFSVPLPVGQDRDAHELWEEVHEFLWRPLAALLVLHVLGALYNHFVRRNDVLRRMTVGG